MEKVGIIGCGNMGRAIAERIKDKYTVTVFDKDQSKLSGLENISVAHALVQLAAEAQIIILAVKPQDFDFVLKEIKPLLNGKLIITIAAGITTKFIQSYCQETTCVIRVMPNMPAQIGRGVSVIYRGQACTENNSNLTWQLAHDIFSNLGSVLPVDKEEVINAATAISGSGPAFFCHYVLQKNKKPQALRDEFVELLTQSAVNLGFDILEARVLSEGTVDGTIAILIEKNLTCDQLIKMVASKGGTTEAGLAALNSGSTLKEATEKAFKRAGELEMRS